jgi:glycosyltransferase involved in cell wall biosynthesis
MADGRVVDPSATTRERLRLDAALQSAAKVDPNFAWVGTVDEPTGYADEMRGFLRVMEAAGYEPALREFAGLLKRAGLSPRDRELFRRQARRPLSGPIVAVHHYVALRALRVESAVNVARTMFETSSVPARRLPMLLERDQIWVPCQFNVETFADGGVPEEKLRVVGGTMDFDVYDPETTEPLPLDVPDDHFVFLTNFAFAERKGWKQLITAWARAFGPNDGVCLVLKTHSESQRDSYVRQKIDAFLNEEFGPGIRERMAPFVVMTDMLSTAELPSLYAAADAYVLPSRGEAWGRPFMEAMAMGLPTIASRWSGNLEFMHDGNSFLVDGELVSVEDLAMEVFGEDLPGHKWFEPDVDDLAATLRQVAGDPAAARERAAGARQELIARFGPEPTARRLADLAREAYEEYGDLRSRPLHSAIRGTFGSGASLAVVNDALANEFTRSGLNIRLEAPHIGNAYTTAAPGITHSWPPRFNPVTDGPTVAILPWEFGSPPRDWVDQVRTKIDRVWVYSDYVRQGYVDAGMPPGIVEVLPLGVDLEAFSPDGERFDVPAAGCTFLFVGGTTWRKGADILIEAWKRAFGPDDDVQLVVKDFGTTTHYRNQTAGADFRALTEREDVAPVVYIEDELPFAEIPALYRAADVLVVPYRGEGFCLPALEAMACGVPVVHNGEGPTGEFVGDIGGWSLPASRVPLPPESKLDELARPGYVHEVEVDALVEQLRAVANDAAGRRERGASALAQAQQFTWKQFAERAKESLATLAAEDLPLARALRRAEIEARADFVVYTPNWADESAWGPALDAWVDTFGPDDDVTLALYVDGDADVIGERIMARLAGHDEAALPDLALVMPSNVSLASLAASAAAVLTAETDPTARPELLRRARRLVLPERDALAELAAQLRESA